MTDRRFRRGQRQTFYRLTEETLDRADLDLVTNRCRCTVCIDVVDVCWRQLGMAQRHFHSAVTTIAIFRRRRDVVRIAGEAIAENLSIDFRAALFRVLVFFKNEYASAFAEQEAVAVFVVRT